MAPLTGFQATALAIFGGLLLAVTRQRWEDVPVLQQRHVPGRVPGAAAGKHSRAQPAAGAASKGAPSSH